jgi:hypothetical protein
VFDAACVPLSITVGTMSAKYAIAAIATDISIVMTSIISTLLIWPKAYSIACSFVILMLGIIAIADRLLPIYPSHIRHA